MSARNYPDSWNGVYPEAIPERDPESYPQREPSGLDPRPLRECIAIEIHEAQAALAIFPRSKYFQEALERAEKRMEAIDANAE